MNLAFDIIQETEENNQFRKIIYTDQNTQLVLMSIPIQEDIGQEIHEATQIINIVSGEGLAIIDDLDYNIYSNSIIIIPQGSIHNIINIGNVPLKLYTIYSPPVH